MMIDKHTVASRQLADELRDLRSELEDYGQTGVILSGAGVHKLCNTLRAMERQARGPKLPPPRKGGDMARRFGRAS